MRRVAGSGGGREQSALSSSFREIEHLQGRLEYAQSLTRSINAIGREHMRANMTSRALDQAHVPVRRSLDTLQTQMHYARLETADDHRRLSQMRRAVSFEAGQLNALQDGIGEVRHRLREARRDAEVSLRLQQLRGQGELEDQTRSASSPRATTTAVPSAPPPGWLVADGSASDALAIFSMLPLMNASRVMNDWIAV